MSKTMTDVVWKPTGKYLDCRVQDFMNREGISDWKTLISRSTADTEWFWNAALDFMGFKWHKPYSQLKDESRGFPWTKWFVDGQLNIVDNVLDWHLEPGRTLGCRTSVGADHMALIWESEERTEARKFTYGELSLLVSKIAGLLLKLGVQPGDAVGIYMPMVPEVAATLLACYKVGAVAIPVFSGFGSKALADRLEDAQAKVLFTADGGRRRGKLIEIKKDADEAAKMLPNLKHVVVMKHCDNQVEWHDRDIWLEEGIASVEPAATKVDLPAEHPCMYLYTSGTTGKPKGTVHTQAGSMAQIAKELGLCFDVQPTETFFWVTDIGWMMGPWEIIGVLFWGGTMVLYEGAPNHPTPDRIWQMVEKHEVTTLGISPTAIRALRTAGEEWVRKHDMSSLRMLGSTGEPWDEDSYMWYFENIGGGRCPVMNISGGTELVGGLLTPLPLMPLKPCSLGGPALGMDIDVFDESGKSLKDGIGHLVCKKPGPSMTKSFLNDDERYIETYFSKFDNVWYHGDWAKVDDDGSWFLFGRSDDTIKVAGKRVGPGEIESVLVEHKDVAEAAVIGVPDELKGESLACFVVLMPGRTQSDHLLEELRALVADRLGKTMRPEEVHSVAALPKTRSGKIVRRSIRAKYLGENPGDLSSVENPDALELISSLKK